MNHGRGFLIFGLRAFLIIMWNAQCVIEQQKKYSFCVPKIPKNVYLFLQLYIFSLLNLRLPSRLMNANMCSFIFSFCSEIIFLLFHWQHSTAQWITHNFLSSVIFPLNEVKHIDSNDMNLSLLYNYIHLYTYAPVLQSVKSSSSS